MADGFSSGDPFSTLEGKDGFHVVSVEFASYLTLSCVAYYGGESTNITAVNPDDATITLVEIENPTPVQFGAVERLRLVLDSVARYLTTGGTWKELLAAQDKMRQVAVGGLVFPGYHLCTSYSTTDGTYQHVFVKNDGSGEAALWEEPSYNESGGVIGGWIEPTTLDKIREDQENDDEVWGAATNRYEEGKRVTDETGDGGSTSLLPLQLEAGSENQKDAQGSPDVRVPQQGSTEGNVHEVPRTGAGDPSGNGTPPDA